MIEAEHDQRSIGRIKYTYSVENFIKLASKVIIVIIVVYHTLKSELSWLINS